MKLLLLPLLAALSLSNAVHVETCYFLVGDGGGIVSAPMELEEQCEQAGEKVTSFKERRGDGKLWFVVNCIKGKWHICMA